MLFDSGTATLSWPKTTELLLYMWSKTNWRVNTVNDAGDIEVQMVLKSALQKGVSPRNISNNCINAKRGVFQPNGSIWGDGRAHAHTHTHSPPPSCQLWYLVSVPDLSGSYNRCTHLNPWGTVHGKVHYYVYNSLPQVPNLSQINPVHIFPLFPVSLGYIIVSYF